jgi:tetratricopeptide (TPR) repeat protein
MSNWAKQAKLAWSQGDYLRAGDFYKMDGNYRLAIKAYERAGQPVRAARIYEDLGKGKKAEKILMKSGTPHDIAQFLMRQSRTTEAIETYLKHRLEYEAAELLEQTDQLEHAADLYRKLNFFEKAGVLYGKSKQMDKAIGALQLAIGQLKDIGTPASKAKIARYQDWIANFHVALGQFEQAGTLFDELMQREKAARCYLKVGQEVRAAEILLKLGRTEEAESILRQKGSAQGRALLGHLLADRGDFRGAAQQLEGTEEFALLADCYEHLGEFAKASANYERVGNFKRAAALYAESGDFRKAAILNEEKGYYDEAGQCYERIHEFVFAARLYKMARNFYRAGLCLFHSGKLEEALEVLQSADEHGNDGPQIKYLTARIFFQQGYYSVASKLLDELVTSDMPFVEDSLEPLYLLARCYEELGEFNEARLYFERVCSRKATYQDVRARLEILSRKLGKSRASQTQEATTLMPNQLTPGEIIAERFRIITEIGKGGMGYIFKVRDMALDRDVALKMLIHNRGSFEELKMELINSRDLTHPYIIKVFDIGEWKNVCYFTMELVKGTSLKAWIESEPLDLIEPKIHILIKICEALQAAHEREIIHRDIKPQNILIDEGRNPKLLDFGIARRKNQVSQNQGISGSPKYMAPEQIQNTGADPRTDIYALGIIMFYMFTKKEPFVGKDANEILLMQINRPLPDPAEINPQIPFWLSEIIRKCCAKNKDLRFSSMNELIEELRLNLLDPHV